MKLRSLDLNQFRCFSQLRVPLPGGIVIFHGDNAQGKTSILEAICVMLRLQSPRTSTLAECARFHTDSFAIGGQIEGDESFQLRLQFRESGRKLIVDGEVQKRIGDYLRHSALVVWMANDDLALVRGGGEGRRKYLDFMASQLFPDYRPALKAYEKALRSRNFLLKRDASPKWQQIDAYTKILHHEGRIITGRRRELVASLDPLASTAQFEISGRVSEDLQLLYECGSGQNDDLMAELGGRRDEEFNKRRTVAGPHRDDLELKLNGMAASKFASEGQQRTIALALKLAQTKLFIQKRDEPPILLIDDVFGELDPARRNHLMATWPVDSQKIITTTNLDWLDEKFVDATRLLVKNGAIEL
ncbi:MAG: DNA replication and repair protein RecF [Verrucomicrobiales bacterium]|nr:DNA replication and repair protein RecF [Verrucomicrobiales bacterium]